MDERTDGHRLIDEARSNPVTNAIRLGWEFFLQNKMLAVVTISAFVVLEFLTMIPLLGLLAMVALGVVGQGVQIYVGRHFYRSHDIVAFVEEAKMIPPADFLLRYKNQALGAWLGWFLVGSVLMLIFMIAFFAGGGVMEISETMSDEEAFRMFAAMGGSLIPVLLIVMVLSYVYPIAQGRIILSESFGEAFRAVFSIFTPAVWREAMRGEYFRFVFVFGLLLLGVSFVAGIVAALLMMIPFLGWLLLAVVMLLGYYVMIVVFAIAEVLALEIAETGSAIPDSSGD